MSESHEASISHVIWFFREFFDGAAQGELLAAPRKAATRYARFVLSTAGLSFGF
jgi:hypothetical protein